MVIFDLSSALAVLVWIVNVYAIGIAALTLAYFYMKGGQKPDA